MKEGDYSIENLIEVFAEQHKNAMEAHKKMCDEYLAKYKMPHPKEDDDFSLAKALSVMCQEIKDINDWIIAHGENH